MANAPLTDRTVAAIFAEGMTQTDADFFAEAIDAAFDQVLHGRFAGGVAVLLVATGGREGSRVLRPQSSDQAGLLVLQLTLSDSPATSDQPHPMHRALRHAVPIGTIERPATDASPVAMALADITDENDPNGSADHNPLGNGVMLIPRRVVTPRNLGDDGLQVFRTTQGLDDEHVGTRQGSRGQLPVSRRQMPVRMQGLGSNGHARALTPTLTLPVGGALIHALGQTLGFSSWPPVPVTSIMAAVSPGVM